MGIDGASVARACHTYQQLRPQRPGHKLLPREGRPNPGQDRTLSLQPLLLRLLGRQGAGARYLLATIAYANDLAALEGTSRTALAAVGAPELLLLGLQTYTPCAESTEDPGPSVSTARGCRVEQPAFYNYGIMPRPNLDWLRSV